MKIRYILLVEVLFLTSCSLPFKYKNEFNHNKTIYKNLLLVSCIKEYNSKSVSKEFVRPDKIILYGNSCARETRTNFDYQEAMDNLIQSIRPILDKKVYIASETMGSLKTLFPNLSCITNECLILYDSKELDRMASDYAVKRIKEENKK